MFGMLLLILNYIYFPNSEWLWVEENDGAKTALRLQNLTLGVQLQLKNTKRRRALSKEFRLRGKSGHWRTTFTYSATEDWGAVRSEI